MFYTKMSLKRMKFEFHKNKKYKMCPTFDLMCLHCFLGSQPPDCCIHHKIFWKEIRKMKGKTISRNMYIMLYISLQLIRFINDMYMNIIIPYNLIKSSG